MKKPVLFLFSHTSATERRLCTQMEEIFKDYVEIKSDYLEHLTSRDQIQADLVLITYHAIREDVLPYIPKEVPYMVARRSPSLQNIKILYSIPRGSNVVIANINETNSLECIQQLENLGIDHLNFVPYYPGIEWPLGDFKYAVTFDEDVIPIDKNVEIFNLGTRTIDITTVTLIAEHFEILDKLLGAIDSAYMQANIQLAYNYYDELTKNASLESNMRTLINHYESSTVIMNTDGTVIFYNERAERLLEIENGTSRYIALLQTHITGESEFFVNIHDEDFYVRRYLGDDPSMAFFVISELRTAEKIENKYRNKLKADGLIAEYHFRDILSNSISMKSVLKKAEQFAKGDSTIYISGESGSGKELLAQAIHNASRRKNEVFVAINFAALSDSLSESELFGYEEGSFTDAKKGGKKGLFEIANHGTIFLDEIGDCSLDIQKKLLRTIQERKIMPIGSQKYIPIDIRILSASNKDLSKLVDEGKFREDLYYRLNVLPLHLPALRERKEDILPLFYSFLKNDFHVYQSALGKAVEESFLQYSWKGNVRELRNMAEYIANCINADIDGWREEVIETLYARTQNSSLKNFDTSNTSNGSLGKFNIDSSVSINDTLVRLETKTEINTLIRILNTLNSPPFIWTRNSLSKAISDMTPSIIKKNVIILSNEGLVITKKGEGTYISSAGKNFLNKIQRN